MTRNPGPAAVATVLVLMLSLVIHNSAYITLIERQLKRCRSGSNEDDSRVRRWGWWGPNIPLQVSVRHTFDKKKPSLFAQNTIIRTNTDSC